MGDIIYEFLIWCDFVYTLCVMCLPLWYTNNMYTLLLSYVFHTVSLSLICFRSLIIESIHSFHEEGVIFIRYMCCSYSLYYDKCLNGMKSFCLFVGYWWCILTVPLTFLYWGFYYTNSTNLCGFGLFLFDVVVREWVRRRLLISIDFSFFGEVGSVA